jgi:hypothetical protein
MRRIIWIDEKKFYILPQTYKVWASELAPASQVIYDPRVLKPMCINYIAAVNYKHGPLLLCAVSGTYGKDYKPRKVYKASRSSPRGPCGLHCLRQHAAPLPLVARAQPHQQHACRPRASILARIHSLL